MIEAAYRLGVKHRDPDDARHWRFARRRYQSMGRGSYGLDLMPPPVTD